MIYLNLYTEETFITERLYDLNCSINLLKRKGLSLKIIERIFRDEIKSFNNYLNRTVIDTDFDNMLKAFAEQLGFEKILNYGMICFLDRNSKKIRTGTIFVIKRGLESPEILLYLSYQQRTLLLTEKLMKQHIEKQKGNAKLYKKFLEIADTRIRQKAHTQKIIESVTIRQLKKI